jgi:hypothetical protein
MISQLINYNAAGTVGGGPGVHHWDCTKPACPSGGEFQNVFVTPGGYTHPTSQTHICDLQNTILMAEAVGL